MRTPLIKSNSKKIDTQLTAINFCVSILIMSRWNETNPPHPYFFSVRVSSCHLTDLWTRL